MTPAIGQTVSHCKILQHSGSGLGVVLYESITGRRPFGSEYDQAAIYAIVNEKHPPASGLRAEIPAPGEADTGRETKPEASGDRKHGSVSTLS